MSERKLDLVLNDMVGDLEKRSSHNSPEQPFMINVCGPSASGKSTISKKVMSMLPSASLVGMDRYLSEGLCDPSRTFNHDSPDPNRPYVGGISPEIWDMRLMESHIASLSRGEKVMMPVFDEKIKDRTGYEPFYPTSQIIVEGGHAFSEPFVSLAEHKILVDAPLHDRLVRKLFRTCVQYGLAEGDEVISRYLTRDEPAHQHYLKERKAIADTVIDNPLCPDVEFGDKLQDEKLSKDNSWALVPFGETGTLKEGEVLQLVRNDGEIIIAHYFDERLVSKSPIAETTYNLLTNHYEVQDHA